MQRGVPEHQANRQFAFDLAGDGDGAAIQHVDHARIAQQQGVDSEELLIALGAGGDAGECGRHDRDGGRENGVEAAQSPLHRGDPACTRMDEVDVVGGRHRSAAFHTRLHARVVALAVGSQQFAVPRVAFGGREAGGRLYVCQLTNRREGDFFDLRAGVAELAHRALERAGDGGLDVVEHHRAGDGELARGQRARIRHYFCRRQDFMGQHGVTHRTRHGADGVQRG